MRSLADLADHQLIALIAAVKASIKNGAEEWEDAWLPVELTELYQVSWDFHGWKDTLDTLESIRYDRS